MWGSVVAKGEAAGDAGRLAGAVHFILLKTPSVFGRLAELASLQNPEKRRQFCHQFVVLGYGLASIEKAVLREHRAIFADWLSLSLEQKLADLEECASLWGQPVADVASDWFAPQKRQSLIPFGALTREVELFESDLELLLPIVLAQKT